MLSQFLSIALIALDDLQDYDTVLAQTPSRLHAEALLGKAKTYATLKQFKEAEECVVSLLASSTLSTHSLGLLVEARALLSSVQTPLPLLPSDKKSTHPVQTRDAGKSMNPDSTVATAVDLINNGNLKEAISLLDDLLSHQPKRMDGFAARGTAKALAYQLQEAIDDFTQAIHIEPRYSDFYLRRGHAYGALEDYHRALEDFLKAADLAEQLNSTAGQASALVQAGKMYQRLNDYRRAQKVYEQIMRATEIVVDEDVYTGLALSLVSQGDLKQGIDMYQKAIPLNPYNAELLLNCGLALKELSEVDEARTMLLKACSLSKQQGKTALQARRLLALMAQGCGNHSEAIEHLHQALAISSSESVCARIELLFYRAACAHTIGHFHDALRHYMAALDLQSEIDKDKIQPTHEALQFLCLSFYQKELLLYTCAHLERPVETYCVDGDLHPEFKELWCKKSPPSGHFVEMYKRIMQPPLQIKTLADVSRLDIDVELIKYADKIGHRLQYNHQGFLSNSRQQRAAGLAIVELACMLRDAVDNKAAGKETLILDAGASSCVRRRGDGSLIPGSSSNWHALSWRDVMDVIVRWRQLSEPGDQVIWVDLLSEKEFNQGFGSHTPMFTGQTKCVRYFMNYRRALGLAKCIILKEGRAYSAKDDVLVVQSDEQRKLIEHATSAEEIWQAIGEDCWVVVPVKSSVRRSGSTLEGTRLTIVKVTNDRNSKSGHQPDAYEFSIRTPVTPARWKEFDDELSMLFKGVMECLSEKEKDIDEVKRAALCFAHCWYNFMPLARGSALCGFAVLHAIMLAHGAPILAKAPKNVQIDWEAILEGDADAFIRAVSPWLFNNKYQQETGEEHVPEFSLTTTAHRLQALNYGHSL